MGGTQEAASHRPPIRDLACSPGMVVEAVEGIRGLREHKRDPGQRPGSPSIEGAVEKAADGQLVRWRGAQGGGSGQCGGYPREARL